MIESAFFQTIVYTFAVFGAAVFLGEIFYLLFCMPKVSESRVTLIVRPLSEEQDISDDVCHAKLIKRERFPNLDIEIDGLLTDKRLRQIKAAGLKLHGSEDEGREDDN